VVNATSLFDRIRNHPYSRFVSSQSGGTAPALCAWQSRQCKRVVYAADGQRSGELLSAAVAQHSRPYRRSNPSRAGRDVRAAGSCEPTRFAAPAMHGSGYQSARRVLRCHRRGGSERTRDRWARHLLQRDRACRHRAEADVELLRRQAAFLPSAFAVDRLRRRSLAPRLAVQVAAKHAEIHAADHESHDEIYDHRYEHEQGQGARLGQQRRTRA